MSKEDIVKALMVRRDGISVKAARLIEEMAEEIEQMKISLHLDELENTK